MAPQVKKYEFRGHNELSLLSRTDPAAAVDAPGAIFFDVTWDNAIASEAAVDAALALYGAQPAGATSFAAEFAGGGAASDTFASLGDPTNALITWGAGPPKTFRLDNLDGRVILFASDTMLVEGTTLARLEGTNGARINSTDGLTEVIGQDVQIVGQAGAGFDGDVLVDAVRNAIVTGGDLAQLHGSDSFVTLGTDSAEILAGNDTGIVCDNTPAAELVEIQIATTTRVRVDSNVTADETPLLLTVAGGGLQRVSVGIASSGGLGFRVLRVPN